MNEDPARFVCVRLLMFLRLLFVLVCEDERRMAEIPECQRSYW